jgi:hypothetical protein
MFQQGTAEVTTASFSEIAAIVSLAGFAVQRAVEILDPLLVGLLLLAKLPSGDKKELPGGVSDNTAKGWLAALVAFLLALLIVGSTKLTLPAMKSFDWHGWDTLILALAISAGANGLNSVLKFGELMKEAKKEEIKPLPVIKITPPVPKVSVNGKLTLLASVTGADIKDVQWKVLEPQSGGTITQEGLYTAPAQPGTYFVAAISVANSDAVESVAVTVVA